jgi:DNA end-binding protein Ku
LASKVPVEGKTPRKVSAQAKKEMLLPIAEKRPAKKAIKAERSTGRRKAG